MVTVINFIEEIKIESSKKTFATNVKVKDKRKYLKVGNIIKLDFVDVSFKNDNDRKKLMFTHCNRIYYGQIIMSKGRMSRHSEFTGKIEIEITDFIKIS